MTIVYILLVLILVLLVYYIFFRRTDNSATENALNKIFPEVLKNANQQLITMADQKIGTDLSNKKDAIEKMIKQVQDQLNKVSTQQLTDFSNLRNAVEFTAKTTKELQISTEALKNTLSDNQKRGAFGEKVAENLLKMSGFVIGTDYTRQETTGDARPDFTLYLPDKTKVNIDSKFPLANFRKMIETTDPNQQKQFKLSFEQDIKKKISDVSSRDYINPEDNTVDFVVVFIPNEMIFSFIYQEFPDILNEAFNKKIVLAGPFSFTAILRMVRQAYENFRFQKNVSSIIAQIKVFGTEFEKYNEEFEKIGDRIDSLHKQYDEVNNARTKKLQKVVDKISIEEDSKPLSLAP